MRPKLKNSVGERGKNNINDMHVVSKLLQQYAGKGAGFFISIPLPALIKEIKEFQKNVLQFKKPDGLVSKNGKTIKELITGPKIPMNTLRIAELRAQGAPGKIPEWLWDEALTKMICHSNNPSLRKYDVITLVDFNQSIHKPRLWLVNLKSNNIILNTYVAHGKKSKGNITEQNFSNNIGTNLSSLGSYVTLNTKKSVAGFRKRSSGKKELALILQGLDSSNNLAKKRYIYFHGATYMTGKNRANSHGCFATDPKDNQLIIDQIKNGSFVYAMNGGYSIA